MLWSYFRCLAQLDGVCFVCVFMCWAVVCLQKWDQSDKTSSKRKAINKYIKIFISKFCSYKSDRSLWFTWLKRMCACVCVCVEDILVSLILHFMWLQPPGAWRLLMMSSNLPWTSTVLFHLGSAAKRITWGWCSSSCNLCGSFLLCSCSSDVLSVISCDVTHRSCWYDVLPDKRSELWWLCIISAFYWAVNGCCCFSQCMWRVPVCFSVISYSWFTQDRVSVCVCLFGYTLGTFSIG